MNGDASSIWRWLAAFLAGVVIAGIPAAFVAFSAPSQDDLKNIQAQLVMNQIQAARIEERLVSLTEANKNAIQELQQQIENLQQQGGK